jgi:hypothetical protein
MPRNEREWIQYQNEMAKWVRYVVKLGDGSITTSGGTTISGLDEMPGQIASERSLLMVNVGNSLWWNDHLWIRRDARSDRI